jgi:hypothetical protein
MESLFTCGLHVNTCSVWVRSTSWSRCKRTTSCQLYHATCHLWSPQQQLQFTLAISEQCAGCCRTHDLWGTPKGNTRRDSCPVNMVARTIHTRSALKIDSMGHSYQTHYAWYRRWLLHPVIPPISFSISHSIVARFWNSCEFFLNILYNIIFTKQASTEVT